MAPMTADEVPNPKTLTGPLDIVAVDRWEADCSWVDDERYDAGDLLLRSERADPDHRRLLIGRWEEGESTSNML